MTTMMRNTSFMERLRRPAISEMVSPPGTSASSSMISMPFSSAGAEYSFAADAFFFFGEALVFTRGTLANRMANVQDRHGRI